MEEFKLKNISPDPSWYHKEKTMDGVIKKLEHWNKILDPTDKTYKNDLEKVEAWRKFYLMKLMIFRAHGLSIFPSRYAGPIPK